MIKVLVVDDREEFLPELKDILEGPDMDVDFAKTFEEAISLLALKTYDIVIRKDNNFPMPRPNKP